MEYKFDFYLIRLGNTNRYLGVNDLNGSKIWTDRYNSIYFETEKNALEFAKNYFKNYKGYQIVEHIETINC